jgi:integrase/recombinase XerD
MRFLPAKKDFLRFCAIERRLSRHTIQAYKFDLLDFKKWLPTDTNCDRVTEEDLKGYLESMVSERGLSAATVRRRLACLRSFFRRLAELGQAKDPFANWRPKLPRRRRLPRTLARSESVALLKSLNETRSAFDRDRHMTTVFRLLVATGLRVGELCGLKLSDVSPDCSVVRVHGKGSRDRVAYVADSSLRESLKKLVASQRSQGRCDGPLMVNRFGAPMKPQSVRSKLRRFAAEAGLERRVTPHMLRHTAATLLIETGVDIRFVQRLLGHSSIATTEIYTHVTDEALRATLERANILESLRT